MTQKEVRSLPDAAGSFHFYPRRGDLLRRRRGSPTQEEEAWFDSDGKEIEGKGVVFVVSASPPLAVFDLSRMLALPRCLHAEHTQQSTQSPSENPSPILAATSTCLSKGAASGEPHKAEWKRSRLTVIPVSFTAATASFHYAAINDLRVPLTALLAL